MKNIDKVLLIFMKMNIVDQFSTTHFWLNNIESIMPAWASNILYTEFSYYYTTALLSFLLLLFLKTLFNEFLFRGCGCGFELFVFANFMFPNVCKSLLWLYYYEQLLFVIW